MSTSVYHPLVRSFIRQSFSFGWSANAIYKALPSIGLPSFHRATFLKVARGEREFLRVGKATQEFSGSVPFDRGLMIEEEFPYPSKYKISGKTRLYDEDNDFTFETSIQMYADDNLGKDGWESEFMSRYEDRYEYEGYSVVGVDFDRISHQPGFRY